jgi:hypothetical protein
VADSASIVEQAQADFLAGRPDAARAALESLGPAGPAAGLLALCRVRLVLTRHDPDLPADGPAWLADLKTPLAHPRLEVERAFARGWLAWLTDEPERAEALLTSAREPMESLGPAGDQAEAAYWRARVQLLLRRPQALAGFEDMMRRRPGSPQTTAWYVDLLGRDGQAGRAGQVWKTVRTNRKVAAVDEACLLEAREHVRRGELDAAEQILRQAEPRGGVVMVERDLLLAWVGAERGRFGEAEASLRRAEAGPYPASFLRTWRGLFDRRRAPYVRTWRAVAPALVPWLLHQAGWAVRRNDAALALQWVRRALGRDPELAQAGDRADVVRHALPELEKKARAQALAAALALAPGQPPSAPEVVAGFAEMLAQDRVGQEILAAAGRGDVAFARSTLAALAARADLSRELAHHLALVGYRAALYAEEAGQDRLADACWRLAWSCWLRVLAGACGSGLAHEGRLGPNESHFLATLLAMHRRFVGDLLGRNAVDAARRHWGYVEALVPLARQTAPALVGELTGCVARFREELAGDYLTATREVMRHGLAGEGWRADYEGGLAYLRRLLSLDRDNLRLLTALADICGEWFLDCYNNEDAEALVRQVSRFTPFALKLARLIEGRPGELAARVALAEFYKFRGFTAADPAEKRALYREAARFDAENENVRQLMAEAEGRSEA